MPSAHSPFPLTRNHHRQLNRSLRPDTDSLVWIRICRMIEASQEEGEPRWLPASGRRPIPRCPPPTMSGSSRASATRPTLERWIDHAAKATPRRIPHTPPKSINRPMSLFKIDLRRADRSAPQVNESHPSRSFLPRLGDSFLLRLRWHHDEPTSDEPSSPGPSPGRPIHLLFLCSQYSSHHASPWSDGSIMLAKPKIVSPCQRPTRISQ